MSTVTEPAIEVARGVYLECGGHLYVVVLELEKAAHDGPHIILEDAVSYARRRVPVAEITGENGWRRIVPAMDESEAECEHS